MSKTNKITKGYKYFRFVKTKMDFKECKYINTWGLMYHCDIYNPDEKTIPVLQYLKSVDWSNTKSNEKIYIGLEYLNVFVHAILDKIQRPFYLITGNGDVDVTMNNMELYNKLIFNPFLIKWFSQNCIIINHPKLLHIPIGLDYHTLATVGKPEWGIIQTPTEQEKELQNIINDNTPKIMKCFSNFHLNMKGIKYSYERENACTQIPTKLVQYQNEFKNRITTWKLQSMYKFIISPHGNGIDCHRTWEALVLGCYPIVKKSGICPLFKDLPVLIVDEWSDITLELLKTTAEKFDKNKDTFNFEKLTLKYWLDYIDLECYQ